MKARQISVRVTRRSYEEETPTLEVGLLIEVPERAFWRYVPNGYAEHVLKGVHERFRRPESDPSLIRLKRRLKGAIFQELGV